MFDLKYKLLIAAASIGGSALALATASHYLNPQDFIKALRSENHQTSSLSDDLKEQFKKLEERLMEEQRRRALDITKQLSESEIKLRRSPEDWRQRDRSLRGREPYSFEFNGNTYYIYPLRD